MGLKLEIDASELSRVAQRLSNISINAGDIRVASEGVRLILQEDVDLRFQNAPNTLTGGRVYGGAEWRELSETYLRQKPYRSDGQLLRDTGELLQSMTIAGHPYNIYAVNESEIVFGTALVKAERLNRDRPFLFWHPVLLEKVATFIINYVNG